MNFTSDTINTHAFKVVFPPFSNRGSKILSCSQLRKIADNEDTKLIRVTLNLLTNVTQNAKPPRWAVKYMEKTKFLLTHF
jgi:hypothetical protein